MTGNTYRNNIQPMFWFITGMMILLCLFFTIMTLQSIRSRQFACYDSVIDSISSFYRFGMTITIFVGRFLTSNLTFFALSGSLLSSFTFSCLPVSFMDSLTLFALLILSSFYEGALFAIRTKTNWTIKSFVKLRQWFDLLAGATSFCYDLLRHFRFSLNNERICLEPNILPIRMLGSFYNNTEWRIVK